MSKRRLCLDLFLNMMKIGAFTFGGGYSMIALLEREFVEKKKWIGDDEFTDLVAIAESTPGPIAVNAATYIGCKLAGVPGASLATLGVCLPSFVVIFIISLFFDRFLSLEYVGYAFKGIQACVTFLILSAGVRMLVRMKKTVFNVAVAVLTMAAVIGCALSGVGFSSILAILVSGLLGLFVYLIGYLKNRGNGKS
ncbi:MAG: chromate transporter [Clostridia bacterium]|nr:chromate transporter [Clostridia bacterium]